MEYTEFSAKTVSEAITEACQKFEVTSDRLDYEVVEEGSAGFLGIGSKPAVIKAAIKEVKETKEEAAVQEKIQSEEKVKPSAKAQVNSDNTSYDIDDSGSV